MELTQIFFIIYNFNNFFSFIIFVFNPMKFNNSTIVNISFTKGIFLRLTCSEKIVAAKIGSVAFLDPDIEILPLFLFAFNN